MNVERRLARGRARAQRPAALVGGRAVGCVGRHPALAYECQRGAARSCAAATYVVGGRVPQTAVRRACRPGQPGAGGCTHPAPDAGFVRPHAGISGAVGGGGGRCPGGCTARDGRMPGGGGSRSLLSVEDEQGGQRGHHRRPEGVKPGHRVAAERERPERRIEREETNLLEAGNVVMPHIQQLQVVERGQAIEGLDAVAGEEQHLQLRQRLKRRQRGEQVVPKVELDQRGQRRNGADMLQPVIAEVEVEHRGGQTRGRQAHIIMRKVKGHQRTKGNEPVYILQLILSQVQVRHVKRRHARLIW